jgi:hypothetical protein
VFFKNNVHAPIFTMHKYYHQTPKNCSSVGFCDLSTFSIANAFFFWVVFDMRTLSNHRRTRRCLVKNAVPTTKNWPLQIIFLAFPDTTIYNKKTIQFSLVHLGSMVVMFFVVYW